jgi:hypothetical protein
MQICRAVFKDGARWLACCALGTLGARYDGRTLLEPCSAASVPALANACLQERSNDEVSTQGPNHWIVRQNAQRCVGGDVQSCPAEAWAGIGGTTEYLMQKQKGFQVVHG